MNEPVDLAAVLSAARECHDRIGDFMHEFLGLDLGYEVSSRPEIHIDDVIDGTLELRMSHTLLIGPLDTTINEVSFTLRLQVPRDGYRVLAAVRAALDEPQGEFSVGFHDLHHAAYRASTLDEALGLLRVATSGICRMKDLAERFVAV